MKNLGIGVLFLSAALIGMGCDDDSVLTSGDAGGVLDSGTGGTPAADAAVDTAPTTTDASGDAAVLTARANLASVGGSTVTGSITLLQSGNSVTVTINVAGATVGQHGIHIHAGASCADTPAAADAGAGALPIAAGAALGHWNPRNMMHGAIEGDGGMHHAGDFGNVTVSADGTGTKVITITEWSVADVLNRAVIVHAGADDLVTNPTGNSGSRVACGVIAAQ